MFWKFCKSKYKSLAATLDYVLVLEVATLSIAANIES